MTHSPHEFDGARMCLNHSQSFLERGLCDLEVEFRQWEAKPHSRSLRARLLENLEDFRWQLDQHFSRVAGDGSLELLVQRAPDLDRELRDIESWQFRLIQQLDEIVEGVRQFDGERDPIRPLLERFIALHDDILREEQEERHFLERGLA